MQTLAIGRYCADGTFGRHLKCIFAPLLRCVNQIGIFIVCFLTLICIPFKDFFASVQRASKRDNNNRTPGEGTCFELGK